MSLEEEAKKIGKFKETNVGETEEGEMCRGGHCGHASDQKGGNGKGNVPLGLGCVVSREQNDREYDILVKKRDQVAA